MGPPIGILGPLISLSIMRYRLKFSWYHVIRVDTDTYRQTDSSTVCAHDVALLNSKYIAEDATILHDALWHT